MKIALPVTCAVAMMVLSGCSPQKDYLYSRSGVTLAQYHADRAACREQSEKAADDMANGRGRPDLVEATKDTRGSPSYRRGNAMALASFTVREECFAARGYVHVPLSAEEDAEVDAISDFEAKLAWMDDFVVRRAQDRVRRIEQARP